MMTNQRVMRLLLISGIILLSTACERKAIVETIVNHDGSMRRNIVFVDADSTVGDNNVFGINRGTGWNVTHQSSQNESGKFDVTFSKTFKSPREINEEMNALDETRFRIRTELERNFRWFYTYYRYSDTYGSLNRLHFVDHNDFFTPEDFAFIDRLPAEGKPISKADSFYLDRLGKRIFEDFAGRGFYEESFHALMEALERNNIDQRWRDSVRVRKEAYFAELLSESNGDPDITFVPLFQRIEGFPGDTAAIRKTHRELVRDFERRTDFMSAAVNLTLTHKIELPWKITASNADSVVGNHAFWAPPSIRYTLKDYTMYAEGRSMNKWAIAVSAAVVVFTGLLFTRKKARSFEGRS